MAIGLLPLVLIILLVYGFGAPKALNSKQLRDNLITALLEGGYQLFSAVLLFGIMIENGALILCAEVRALSCSLCGVVNLKEMF